MDFRVYSDEKDNKVVWLPDTVSYFRLSEAHIGALHRYRARRVGISNKLTDEDSHLIEQLDHANVLNELSTNRPPINEIFSPVVNGFRIVLTEACNFACANCFSTTAIRDSGRGLRTMDSDTLRTVIQRIVPYGQSTEITLHFFGGEPLLRVDLIKLAVSLCEEAVNREEMLPPCYAVTTNGSILDNEIIDFLRRHRFRTGVSIEESKAVHNKIRVRHPNSESTFDLVALNYDRLVAAAVDVHVLVTPQLPVTFGLVDSIRELIHRFPMKTITINTPYRLDSLEWLVSSEYVQVLIECHKLGAEFCVEVESALTPCLAAIAFETPRRSPQSKIGRVVTAGVTTDGSLVRSTHKWSAALVAESWDKFEARVVRSPECLDCEARALCGGPNEEFQVATGRTLDDQKCGFFRHVPSAIAKNLEMFQEDAE